MRALQFTVLALLLASTAAQAGTIPFLPGFEMSDTVEIVAPSNTLAIFKQEEKKDVVKLSYDPSSLPPHTPLIKAASGRTLLFDYMLYEFGTDAANPDGNTEMLRAVLTSGSTGAEISGFEFTASMWESGTASWDLTSLAGQKLGIRFEMISDSSPTSTDTFSNGHLNVWDLRIVPTPTALLAALPFLGAALLWRRARRRR